MTIRKALTQTFFALGLAAISLTARAEGDVAGGGAIETTETDVTFSAGMGTGVECRGGYGVEESVILHLSEMTIGLNVKDLRPVGVEERYGNGVCYRVRSAFAQLPFQAKLKRVLAEKYELRGKSRSCVKLVEERVILTMPDDLKLGATTSFVVGIVESGFCAK